MIPIKKACKTNFILNAIDSDIANSLYLVLKDEIPWEQGIKSKKGETRLAYACNMGDFESIDMIICQALKKLNYLDNYAVMGIYLNYYRNGQDWTPNHNHPGSHQLVLSLGTTRTLELGKKSYKMNSGSAIIFGSGTHGVPKDPNIHEGRISIATFMIPIQKQILI